MSTVEMATFHQAIRCTREWAMTADDILWRRSKLGLHMPQKDQDALRGYMAGDDAAQVLKRVGS